MHTREISRKERILRCIRGEETDRIPTIGGWNNGVRNLSAIAGITTKQYLADPLAGVVKANLELGVDGMVAPAIPKRIDEIRSSSVASEAAHEGTEPEALLERANSLPDNEKEVLASFDARRTEAEYRRYFDDAFGKWRGIEPIPNFWEIGGHFPLYHEFGYQAFLLACALYPDAVGRIWWARSVCARERAKILIRLYNEYELVPLMFCGEDVCNNAGPMVSPDFLRSHYFPTVAMIIEPLVDAGIRLVHHCDGDVRPVVKDFLTIGFSGLQGFQYELGVDLYDLARLRDASGRRLIFFAGLNVTRTLPFGTPEDAIEEVEYLVQATGGGQGMFLFTSNVTGVEVPPENIRAAYEHAQRTSPSPSAGKPQWPWGTRYGAQTTIRR